MRSLGRWLGVLAGLVVLGACNRPLTPAEDKFAADLFGPSLDRSKVSVAQGIGITPLYRTKVARITRVQGTGQACVRTPQPRGAQPPQAFAFRNRVHFESGLYSSDMVINWPDQLRVPQALVLAHELTHVWQWQNRDRTGYSPFRAVAESWRLADPYYSGPGEAAFFSLGYEQQAAIVEDYVCFTFANPGHPRRQELRAILAPVFPVDAFDAALGR
ncbi:MAG: hypothetical protein HKN18_04730 [Silicimonas sp.]|nr:hypothetical protein [Silicimonas sp.]